MNNLKCCHFVVTGQFRNPKVQPFQGFLAFRALFPLDRCRRLGRAVEDDAVDLAALVGDAGGDGGEHVVGHARPVGGHGVLRADRAQDDGGAVGALVALDADRVNVGE